MSIFQVSMNQLQMKKYIYIQIVVILLSPSIMNLAISQYS